MRGEKMTYEFEINSDHLDWLKEMAQSHGLSDEHKALRVLVDYAQTEGDGDLIFETIRCNRC